MFQKYICKKKFYPSADNFTQKLLVMVVTNITSAEYFTTSFVAIPSVLDLFWTFKI